MVFTQSKLQDQIQEHDNVANGLMAMLVVCMSRWQPCNRKNEEEINDLRHRSEEEIHGTCETVVNQTDPRGSKFHSTTHETDVAQYARESRRHPLCG